MQSVRNVLAAAGVGLVVGALFLFWVGWPGFVSVGVGAVFGVGFLIVATSLGADPGDADAAWRERAGDLAGDLTSGDDTPGTGP